MLSNYSMYYPTGALASACGTFSWLIKEFCPPWCHDLRDTVLTVCRASVMSSTKAPAGHFLILYFAAASTFTSKTSEAMPAPLRADHLFGKLEERYPGIGEKVLSSCAVTVNLEYVALDEDDAAGAGRQINEGDEVAIIPPVSSG